MISTKLPLLALLSLLPSLLFAQKERPPVQLSSRVETKDVFTMPYGSGISLLPAGHGAFYVQEFAGPDPHEDRISRINFNGDQKIALDVDALSKLGVIPAHEYYLTSYAADPRGGLVAVVAWGDRPMTVSKFAILDVDNDGDVRSFINLNDGFTPNQAEAFYSGDYLIAGRYPKDSSSTLRLQIRDLHGQVIVSDLHIFSKPATSTSRKPAKNDSGNNEQTKQEPFSQYDDAAPGLSLSLVMASSEDDHVYAYSVRAPGVIEKFSDTGQYEPIKVAKLPLPPDQTVRPIDMYAIDGEVLLHFASFSTEKPDPKKGLIAQKQYWSAYDAYSGSLLQTYTSNSDDWGARSLLVGYSPGSFYFLGAHQQPSGEVAYSLLHAVPQ